MVSYAKIALNGTSDPNLADFCIKNKDKIKIGNRVLSDIKRGYKKVKVGDKEVNVSESGSTTEVSISKKDIKVKKPGIIIKIKKIYY